MVASVVVGADGKSSLYLRGLESEEMRKLPDSENAAHPFWSPDSRWIGFFSGDKLKKVDTAGGPAIALCDAQDGRGGSWSREGAILFQPRFSDPLFKVAAGGGTPEPVTTLDEKRFHVAHRWPMFLPDGRRFLFYVVATTNPASSEHSGIYLGSLDSPEIRQVVRVDSRMAYAQRNLLYKRGSTLMAQPFDPEQARVTGDPLPLAAEVSGGAYSWGGADFGVSDQGVLAYRAGTGGGQTELAWFDRAGKRLGQVGEPDFYYDLRLSRDGRRVAINIGKDAGDLWLHDLGRDVRTRFTFDPADDTAPVFSPDGTRVAFVSARK
ncbi:MAG: TolB family protein, partial [Gemmatimonadales bacterium]